MVIVVRVRGLVVVKLSNEPIPGTTRDKKSGERINRSTASFYLYVILNPPKADEEYHGDPSVALLPQDDIQF